MLFLDQDHRFFSAKIHKITFTTFPPNTRVTFNHIDFDNCNLIPWISFIPNQERAWFNIHLHNLTYKTQRIFLKKVGRFTRDSIDFNTQGHIHNHNQINKLHTYYVPYKCDSVWCGVKRKIIEKFGYFLFQVSWFMMDIIEYICRPLEISGRLQTSYLPSLFCIAQNIIF